MRMLFTRHGSARHTTRRRTSGAGIGGQDRTTLRGRVAGCLRSATGRGVALAGRLRRPAWRRRQGAGPAVVRAAWERPSPELDAELMEALAGRGGDAVAALFDAYAAGLYDYAATLLGGGQGAAQVVHDTLIDASRRAPRSRDHRQLGAWLYAGVRRRIRHRAHAPYFEPTGEPTQAGPAGPALPAAQLALLHGVMGALERTDQETLLLSVRHGLPTPALAATFGVSARAAARRTGSARDRADVALAAEQLRQARHCAAGREPATDAAAAVGPVGEHVLGCAVCLRRGHLTLGDLLTAPATPLIPAGLREWVLHTATDPQLGAYRANITARGGTLTEHGMPRQGDAPPPLVRRARMSAAKTAAGGTAILAATLTATLAIGTALLPMLVFPPRPPATARAHHHRHPALAADPLAAHRPMAGPTATVSPSGHPLPRPTPSPSAPPATPKPLPPGGPSLPSANPVTQIPLPAPTTAPTLPPLPPLSLPRPLPSVLVRVPSVSTTLSISVGLHALPRLPAPPVDPTVGASVRPAPLRALVSALPLLGNGRRGH